jgi:iron-sulfur cluster assembly accessory protein
MNTAIEAPVKLTPGAIKEIYRLINEPDFDSSLHLRIGVKGGGCSGLSYVLGFDQKGEKDNEYEVEGIRYIMDKSHEMYLAGMEVDWQEGLNNRGFTFNNPNASSTCGCGSSFGV